LCQTLDFGDLFSQATQLPRDVRAVGEQGRLGDGHRSGSGKGTVFCNGPEADA
jgi:hypothetical protein